MNLIKLILSLIVISIVLLNMTNVNTYALPVAGPSNNPIDNFNYYYKQGKFKSAGVVSDQVLFGPLYKTSFPKETIFVLNKMAAKFDQIGISSLERLYDSKPGNHKNGLAIDVEFIIKNGVKYSHYAAFKGNVAARKVFTEMALLIANTNFAYQILTAGSFANELRRNRTLSASEGKGTVNVLRIGTTADGVDSNQRHEDHFHIDIKRRLL